ncbi:MAG: hypothetical protein K2X66_09250, partial [Cyanobacteria bacterium]|nr:hypothetical protein [Cyanobacteriota bacterium]
DQENETVDQEDQENQETVDFDQEEYQDNEECQNVQENEETLGASMQYGQRQAGPTHQLLDLTGKDRYALMENIYGVTFPESIKAQPFEDGLKNLESDPALSPIKEKMEAYERAGSSGGYMFDFGPALSLTTQFFQYLGYCQGKGQDAEGNPVKVVNLDETTV